MKSRRFHEFGKIFEFPQVQEAFAHLSQGPMGKALVRIAPERSVFVLGLTRK
ncbi:MAG: hypothetical protein NTZ09_20765 [Candidatus Hydrogenedentes bacterium]|nr:hypothetical protein [Candidatus Hydrogenedentota bacterium]